MERGPELSVVLVNHNGADCLPGSLEALAAGTASERVEGIVVDSGSGDGSWRGVESHWPVARALRFEENIGFCAGCNRGAAEAAGRLLAFVNFDGRVEPGWDAQLRALLEDPGVAVATGLLLRPDGEEIEAAGLEIAPNMATYGRQEGEPRSAAPAGPVEVPAASGALMMVRRDDFLSLGGFYEPLFMYGEEADYCLRAPGRVMLDASSAIRHATGHAAGPARSTIRLYWPARNRLVNAARHLPPAALARSLAASAAFDLLTLAQVRRGDAARAVARGWGEGLRAMGRERRTRTPADRRAAAAQVVPLRRAIAQQRRLGRV
ncbi:MAG TPA: glycosyltransferase family 2 protein [Solirubrobacteraceae bacterium]